MGENINHKLVVCGDIHLQSNHPKYDNVINTLDWIFNNKELNNENNSVLFLGDICEINSPFSCFEKFVDYFVNHSHFNRIYLLTGNHDVGNLDNVLSLFRPLKNVEVITEWKTLKFYNCNFLLLPHYSHEGTDKLPMHELYSNLYKTVTEEFDYGFSHVEDQTENFSRKFSDVSKLNVKQWLNGHIHTCNIQNGGHYLGSACMNSVSEVGTPKYIAIIDGEDKSFELKELPKFMEYYEVSYPNPLPKIPTKFGIFLVRDALDKNDVIEEYSKQAEKLGYTFYARKVLTKKSKSLELDEVEQSTDKPTFEQFAKSVGLSDSVSDICKQVINLKGE